LKYKRFLIANIFDIALMKLEVIAGRGNKKDFIDLYFLLKKFVISDLFTGYKSKYGVDISNHYHLLKSLVYFDDAELQPMPVMIEKIAWQDIKDSIIAKVKKMKPY
jgi:hypothetical protein